ncbi:MAG: methionine--tRNA ligase [Actinobacteria bacterium]|uniref:methionine--tRNA ligase n=1 Tax=freshwater metagenome TaxID=449393 RepID=A0A6J7DK40_9ZZZZ|nr:methionine--tRNA ligase [Actinomycetota bacterium]
MSSAENYFITTPIFYVNDVPHIGHAYTEVAADVLARWNRQNGKNAWLLTGTDEHGQKILRTSTANGVTPKEWADKLVADAWLPLLDTITIQNDDFIRTTDERHEVAVSKFLQKLKDDGFVYSGEYEGFYCVGCEEYKQPGDLLDGGDEFPGEKVCAIHTRPIETLKESNYFFRMSDFQQKLLDLYESQPDFIQPESVRNEIISFVKRGLDDLSISRATFDWGVKIPWDDSHVVYVWFDALLNYISATGWGADDDEFAQRWPAIHIVGKDIARFHAVIWPAMLMAAGLQPPRRVFGHGWLLVGGEKMSKSKLTGIAPHQITDVFGADAFRYYFMSAINFGQDGSFSWEDLAARYQAELANGFGNLASRVIAMVNRYCDDVVPAATELNDADAVIVDTVASAFETANRAIDRLAIHDAINSVWTIVDALNLYITEQEPWVLAKDDANRDRLHTVLYTAVEGLRAIAAGLSPVMPTATQKLWDALGLGEALGALTDQHLSRAGQWGIAPAGIRVSSLDSLFPRIEE